MTFRVTACALLLTLAACSSGGAGRARTPSIVPPVVGERALLAGGFLQTLAPGPQGELLAWGDNASGELGDGSAQSRNSPVMVGGLGGHGPVIGATAGMTHSMAVTSDGSVFAWGHNASGELGDATSADRLLPALVQGVHGVRAVSAGDGFSLALESDGSVLAWGNNASGELGDGNAPIDHASPATVYGLSAGSGVIQIAAGYSFGLVLKSDGSVLGWGNGTSGQLGDGTTDKRSAPTPVSNLGPGSGVIQIAAGGSSSLALKSDGTVLTWGNNESGELGDGKAPTDSNAPVQVTGLGPGSGVIQVAAGGSFDLALKSDGTVLAWGNNTSGELGDRTTIDRATPVQVSGLGQGSGVVAISAGGSHCVALKKSGEVLAWGNNSYGQLGDGTAPTDHPTPVIAFEASKA